MTAMKVYPNLDVRLTYQNFGSTWHCILRGSTEEIDLAFNGLYNLGATNGDYQFFDHAKTVATFWSDRKSLRRFFFNQVFMPVCAGNAPNQGRLIRRAMKEAQRRMAELREDGHEFFTDYGNQFAPTVHGVGKVSAERPDSDFKDSVLNHAFANK
jgi:hypothetical protein